MSGSANPSGQPESKSPAPVPAAASAPAVSGSASGSGSAPASASPKDSAKDKAATSDPASDPKGPDEGKTAEATGSYGEGSATHEALRQAETAIGGDLVHGDKLLVHLYNSTKPVAPRELSGETKDSVKYAFVAPEGWDDLRARSQRHCVLILRAAPGEGRRASALRLLDSRQHTDVYELEPEVDLDRLVDSLQARADRPGKPGSAPDSPPGFVLSDPTKEARLSARMVRALDTVLRRTGGCLIVTVDPDLAMEHELLEFVLDLPRAPARQLIVTAHLRWRMTDGTTLLADQQLERQDVAALVTATLGVTATCSDAAALATILWEELDGAPDELERVRSRYARRSDNEFDTWFGGLPDLESRCFAIALAVFNGLPYEEVTRAARSLLRRLERQAPPLDRPGLPEQPRWRDPFAMPRAARMQRLRAQVAARRPARPTGPPPSLAASYLDVRRAETVLERAWTDYEIQDEILGWLLGLIDEPTSQRMQYHVCIALGLLARTSFAYLQTTFLDTWSVSDDSLRRDVVAHVLREAARDPYVHPQVERFADALFRGTGSWQAQATAARIYGVGLGRSDAATAFAKLDRLILVNNLDMENGWQVAQAVAGSFVSLILDGPDSLYRSVLANLSRWNDDSKRCDMAHLVFLAVATRIVRTVPRTRADGDQDFVVWPALLHIAQTDEVVRTPLFTLWHETLHHPLLRYSAARVLRSWAGAAERDDEILAAFGRLARSLAKGDAGTAALLLSYAEEWSDDEELVPLLRAAETIRRLLREPSPGPGATALPPTASMPTAGQPTATMPVHLV